MQRSFYIYRKNVFQVLSDTKIFIVNEAFIYFKNGAMQLCTFLDQKQCRLELLKGPMHFILDFGAYR